MSCQWSVEQLGVIKRRATALPPEQIELMARAALTGILGHERMHLFGQAPLALSALAYEYVEGMLLAGDEFWARRDAEIVPVIESAAMSPRTFIVGGPEWNKKRTRKRKASPASLRPGFEEVLP